MYLDLFQASNSQKKHFAYKMLGTFRLEVSTVRESQKTPGTNCSPNSYLFRSHSPDNILYRRLDRQFGQCRPISETLFLLSFSAPDF